MFVRFISDWPPYRGGQCLEIPDHIGAVFAARGGAEVITAAEFRAYEEKMAVIDHIVASAVDTHFNETPRADRSHVNVSGKTGGRVVTQDQWRREIGQDRPGYELARQAHQERLADLTTRRV